MWSVDQRGLVLIHDIWRGLEIERVEASRANTNLDVRVASHSSPIMPVQLPVAPIPSDDPKKKKEKNDDDTKTGSNAPTGKATDTKVDEEELVCRLLPFIRLHLIHIP